MRLTWMLLIKDLRLLRAFLVIGFVVCLFSMLPFMVLHTSMVFVMSMGMFSLVLAIQSIEIERKSNTLDLLCALPVSHQQVILSKYLLYPASILLSGLGYGCAALLSRTGIAPVLLAAMGTAPKAHTIVMPVIHLPTLLLGLALGAILIACIIPLAIFLNPQKSVWILMGVMMALMYGMRLPLQAVVKGTPVLLTMGAWYHAAALLLVAASWLGLGLSYRASCNIMAKKRCTGKILLQS